MHVQCLLQSDFPTHVCVHVLISKAVMFVRAIIIIIIATYLAVECMLVCQKRHVFIVAFVCYYTHVYVFGLL